MKTVLEEMAQPYLIRIIEEDKEAIAEKINTVWNQKKETIMLDGFRKGKVPQTLAEGKLGFQNLYRDYIDELITTAIDDVNSNNDVTVVDLQQVIPEALGKEGIVLQAVAYLKPHVLDLDYTNIEATKLDSEATDDEVNGQIAAHQEQNALISPVTGRGVQFGDKITLSFTGSTQDKDGNWVPFPGGSTSKQPFELQEKSFIPGFGEQIVGMNPEESKTFKITFPEEYHAENLKGKEASFDITVHDISTKNLPELDDDFAATCGFESFEAMRSSLKESISSRKKEHNQSRTETEICLELVKRAKISPLPTTMIQKRLQTLLTQEANNFGMSPEDYLKQRKMDTSTYERQYHNIATRDLKIQIILDHIAESEKFEATEADREEYVAGEAERMGYTAEQIKNLLSVEQLDSQIKMRKAYDFLLENANYKEAES